MTAIEIVIIYMQVNTERSKIIYTGVYDIIYQILQPYIVFVFDSINTPLDEKKIVDLIHCNL